MRSPLSLYILLTSLALGLGAGAHHQGRGLGTPTAQRPELQLIKFASQPLPERT
jgi:hypothetical protein